MIEIHPHALERAAERGATEEEIRSTVENGDQFPAKLAESDFAAISNSMAFGAENVMLLSRSRLTPSKKIAAGSLSRS